MKEHSLFYNHIEENDYNKEVIKKIIDYSIQNPNEQIYLVNSPLGEKNISMIIKKKL